MSLDIIPTSTKNVYTKNELYQKGTYIKIKNQKLYKKG